MFKIPNPNKSLRSCYRHRFQSVHRTKMAAYSVSVPLILKNATKYRRTIDTRSIEDMLVGFTAFIETIR